MDSRLDQASSQLLGGNSIHHHRVIQNRRVIQNHRAIHLRAIRCHLVLLQSAAIRRCHQAVNHRLGVETSTRTTGSNNIAAQVKEVVAPVICIANNGGHNMAANIKMAPANLEWVMATQQLTVDLNQLQIALHQFKPLVLIN